MSKLLLTPFKVGRVELKNRVVMAPMTRSRATGNVPQELTVTYYTQRAEAGLIITEGTSPSPNGLGYARIPGLFNAEQVAGWKKVTESVHREGSRIFVQLMHTGRVAHSGNLPKGGRVLGPSAIAAPGQMYTDAAGLQDHPVPEAMTEADIEAALVEFETSAKLAIEAGFDGVELHGANGYLIEQFLNVAANQRTDRWGGSVDNRLRFALEAVRRVSAAIGADRVGIRISPHSAAQGHTSDAATDELYTKLATELGKLKIAYLNTADHSSMGGAKVPPELYPALRKAFGGPFILSGGFDAARAEAALEQGLGDLIAFGRPFLANPRLVSKIKSGAALLPPDFATLYTPGPKGYTDFPL